MMYIAIPKGCHNKITQSKQLKTTGSCAFTVLALGDLAVVPLKPTWESSYDDTGHIRLGSTPMTT